MAKQVHYGRFFDTGNIEEIKDIANQIAKESSLDDLTAYSIAVEIQRNQIIREALYLYEDGDGPVLIEIANAFSSLAKSTQSISDRLGDIYLAIENLRPDE